MSWLPLLTASALGSPSQPPTNVQSVSVRFHPRGEKGILLEGILHIPADAEPPFASMILCHPDPRMAGTMDDAVVIACARALIGRGIAVLRFNFRGVGIFIGEFGEGLGEVRDVLGALDCLAGRDDIDRDRIFLGGYSFGAAMALKALPKAGDARGYAAVALPFTGTPAQREEFAFIENVKVPLFVVIGEMDQYGSSDAIRRFFEEKQARARVMVIPQADHFLYTSPDALDRATDALAQFVAAQMEVEGED